MNGEQGALDLDHWTLLGAAALVLVNGVISAALKLHLEKQMLIASIRTVVQLTLLGLILVPVFDDPQPWKVALIAVAMFIIASVETVRRLKHKAPNLHLITGVSIVLGAGATSFYGVAALIDADPWWDPRYSIPLVGMMIGNILTGITLGLDRALEELSTGAAKIEAMLARGATWWEAARPTATAAVRTGMLPILNAMTVVGLVTIPGMMTGQIVGGTSPALAARYQILVMFLIAAAVALGTVTAVLWTLRTCFDDDHRLRSERIRLRNPK